MTLDATELAQVAEIAQVVAAEQIRNLSRGTGGAVFPLLALRTATVLSGGGPGDEVVILVDGEDDVDQSPGVNATGWSLYPADRVLVTFVPPHGVYATSLLSGYGRGEWTPLLAGGAANASGSTAFGHYTARQKHVRAWGRYTLGASPGSWGTAAVIGGLPYPVRQHGDAGAVNVVGTCYLLHVATGGLFGPGEWIVAEGNGGGQLWFPGQFAAPGFSVLTGLSSTVPVAQGAGDSVYFEIEYDAD